MQINVTWHNAGPHTIYGKLAARLGREPTAQEVRDDMQRIRTEALVEMAEAGKIKHQRGR